MKNSIFAIPVFDKWLLHAPLHDLSALINDKAFQQLVRDDIPKDATSLVALREALIEAPEHHVTTKEGDFDPQFLAIVTTRGCNIDCVYCDFGGPTSERIHMSPDLAVKAIDWMADCLVANNRTDFFLHFFGGEPFISAELVEIIVHRTRAVCAERGLRPHFDASTNGVFGKARASWVGDYFDSIVLSFDGPPEFQNRNRPAKGGRETFEVVSKTATRLSQTPLELCLRVCITGESVSQMPAITRWMAETYHPSVINFEPLTENDLTAKVQLPAADPIEFARKWMESKKVADEMGVRLVYSATDSSIPRLSSCPVGSDTIVVTPDGSVNGCYLQPQDWLKHGMDMSLGQFSRDSAHVTLDHTQVDRIRNLIVDKPRCESCFCQWSCAGGCHVSNTYNGCSTDYINFCIQTRIITACLLLEDLGQANIGEALLSDDLALRRLANHSWDPLENLSSPLSDLHPVQA